MAIEVTATYENGVLRLDEPLSLKEHERVRVSITPMLSLARQGAGRIRWMGSLEDLREIAESPDAGVRGS
jgi:predicted DNA-binding antitoxin AbrB/MazE fold protein